MFDLVENPMQIACETGVPAPASENRWTMPFDLQVPIDLVAMLPEGDFQRVVDAGCGTGNYLHRLLGEVGSYCEVWLDWSVRAE